MPAQPVEDVRQVFENFQGQYRKEGFLNGGI